ncbi:MAG TPA: hypothetical protein VG796_02895 [Verrucomicrobiales bacterium]|jgi:hypothetical protein|nr:hypothetical protein [Verrucomicrobiales bacterium]
MITSNKKSDWHIPWDHVLYFFPGILIIPGLMVAALVRPPLLFLFASGVAIAGWIMLFVARLPLYRQRRFFAFGPAALDTKHRRLYWRAYKVIGCGAAILLLLNAVVRW